MTPYNINQAKNCALRLIEIQRLITSSHFTSTSLSEITDEVLSLANSIAFEHLRFAQALNSNDCLRLEIEHLKQKIKHMELLLQYTEEHFSSIENTTRNETITALSLNYHSNYEN